MTDPTPREIARRYTRRAFSVLRVAAGLASAADRDVARLGRQLQAIVAGYDLEDIGRSDLAALLREVEAAVALAYGTIGAWQLASITELLEIEATWAARALGGSAPSDTAIARALRDLLILGAPLIEHWSRQGDNLAQRVADIIRDAANGVPGVIRDAIRDAIAQAQRDATSLADVGASSAAQQGRAEAARANGAIAWRWISVLDGRTTTGCAIRNGLVYGFDYSPIGHTIPIERPPPRHWGCRSLLTPLLRMPREGDVDFDQTFEEWLGSLSRDEQDDVLGKGKADLFRRGVITKRDLVDQRGRELTLRELRGRID